jgi:hypothetical protein
MKLYKPNKSNKGSALSINYSAKTDKEGQKGDKSFYFQLVAQNGWNEESGNGIFKDGRKIITKFAAHEIAGMLAAIKRNISLAEAMNVKYVYHDGEKTSTSVYFEPFFKSEKKGNEWVKTTHQSGFLFRVTKTDKSSAENKETIGIGFTWAEVELLKVVLKDGLSHIANAWYAENIAIGTGIKEKASKKAKSAPKQEETEPQIDPDIEALNAAGSTEGGDNLDF